MHINYWREIKRSSLGRCGPAILLLIICLAVAAPLIAPYLPGDYTGTALQPPSARHWLGTNDVGQDIWSRLLFGARTSLATGLGVALLSLLISLVTGGGAALSGGTADRLLMRLVDVFIVIPPVIAVILAASYLRPGMFVLIVLLSAFLWPGGARVIRSQALTLKERMHVLAAGAFGAGRRYLLLRHIAPDMGPVLAFLLIQNARRAVFMEAGLSFLGISDPAIISWGKMMRYALEYSYLDVWKWWLLPAGFALSLTITGLAFTGFALETALNPRLREEVKHAGN